jgi:hypothetical protein
MALLFNHPITNRPITQSLAPIPVQIAAVTVDVAIFAAEFAALVPDGSVAAAVQIVTQFASIQRNSVLVMPDVAPVAPCIVGKHRSRAHSQQQQNPSDCPFHLVSLLRSWRILLDSNPSLAEELR